MSQKKTSLPSGVRDMHPSSLMLREHIITTLKRYFQRYSFMPLETPAIESLHTLMGKYGQEGDQLIFKILNSGDFRKRLTTDFLSVSSRSAVEQVAEKGLRYDLTLPLARYVAQHSGQLVFPFRRYQIQPVWRADRPQKGRYREFYQCDIDIVGSNSLFAEAEILALVHEVMQALGLKDCMILLNHRGIFQALATTMGIPNQEQMLCRILDKRDKVGDEKVIALLKEAGCTQHAIDAISWIFNPIPDNPQAQLFLLQEKLGNNPAGEKALEDLRVIYRYLNCFNLENRQLMFSPTLARGMDYYTGAIFEITSKASDIGSLAGGGRYDQLTEIFGLKDTSGVGISFGLERIYDLMLANNLFPLQVAITTQLLIIPMLQEAEKISIDYLVKSRQEGIITELFPYSHHLRKGLRYAQKQDIGWVAILGEEEISSHYISLKNMRKGVQKKCIFGEMINLLKEK
ncbi:MAG: histidine--tRNA ligase [Bacteroidota bacterium]